MNILREVRKVKEKSMFVRIRLLLTFSVIFIVTTYAWFSTQKDVTLGGLSSDVTAWDAYYTINDGDEYFEKTAVFEIDALYPGMADRNDFVHIYNRAETPTDISYELLEVTVFGETIWEKDGTDNKITIDTTTNPVVIFDGDTAQNAEGTAFPFEISYTYDKTRLTGAYTEGDDATASTNATFQFSVKWTYEDEDETALKDALDTQFGKNAYKFYTEDGGDLEKAIEVKVKITSSKGINPS